MNNFSKGLTFLLPRISFVNPSIRSILSVLCVLTCYQSLQAQIFEASKSEFTWITKENVTDLTYGSGYTMYSAAWPIFDKYPGSSAFQMGLASSWMSPHPTGTEPDQFYNTIEGGLGWWRDTRFGTRVPKFIMGGVSNNFFSWANGPGAGRSDNLSNGQRDWSTPGGKYGVAQLSNRLLWAPDGLNMAQGLNGEMLGYGYTPLPIFDPLEQTNGQDISTGNQCWTLILNTTNFKGPATFFVPTFWTTPVLFDPSLEGLFFDSRPSSPNVSTGIEHAQSPALISLDPIGNFFAKTKSIQFPASSENSSIVLNQFTIYSKNAFWNDMESWFNGGDPVPTNQMQNASYQVSFTQNGGDKIGEIIGAGFNNETKLDFFHNSQFSSNSMGFEFDLNKVKQKDGNFILPQYFQFKDDNFWHQTDDEELLFFSDLLDTEVPNDIRPGITYVTPLEPDCIWQDPDGPWNNPGPVAGPFTAEMGDGSTLSYHWYRFVDQPAIIHANLPEEMRTKIQERVELLHSNWSHTDEYMADVEVGNLATVDPAGIVQPPPGLEIGYVPIVTRQEKTKKKLRVFILAGQSNMQGYGTISDPDGDPGTLEDVILNDEDRNWSEIGEPGNWTSLDDAYLYFDNDGDITKSNVTVGQGARPELIGPELMFAHQLDEYYEDPILIIKTAYGGKSLAVDFRPPSAGGSTGSSYEQMILTVNSVTQNLENEFPDISVEDVEITGFAWFQGWNDGAEDSYLNEYESNLYHLVNDLRNDLEIPDLPIVIANSGQGGFESTNDTWVQSMQNIVALAQEAVGCNDTLYGGKLGFIDTKQFYQDASLSPQDAIHHYNNNALTYLNIGKSLGNEMILAINDMAYCNGDCENLMIAETVSVGNRVWNDYNRNGINEANEPGIEGVRVLLWRDSDGDDIPDWQGFGGVQITDEEGYYSFNGLAPGVYVVFVWGLENWEEGQALHGFQSSPVYEPDVNNDLDLDNNGSGVPFIDIFSDIITLSPGDEPLNDGDPFSCFFDFDGSGNNTVDFGFFNPDITSVNENLAQEKLIDIFPNPASDEITIEGELDQYQIEIYDSVGKFHQRINPSSNNLTIDISFLHNGMYLIKVLNNKDELVDIQKFVKQ